MNNICMQCLADSITIGNDNGLRCAIQVARKNYYGDWRKGEYALVYCNDPFLIFHDKPKPIDDDVSNDIWINASKVDHYIGEYMYPYEIYELFNIAIKAGYNPDGYFGKSLGMWLFDRIGRFVEIYESGWYEKPITMTW